MKPQVFILGVALVLSGCFTTGSNVHVVTDVNASPAVQQGRNYSVDLNECRSLAQQANIANKSATKGIGGAAAGAALGAIAGAFTGSPGTGAGLGAALGGAAGLGSGAYSGVSEREAIVKNCMRGRGWNVLN